MVETSNTFRKVGEDQFIKLKGSSKEILNPDWVKQIYPETYNDIHRMGEIAEIKGASEMIHQIYCKSCNHAFWVYRRYTITSKDKEGIHRCPFCSTEDQLTAEDCCGYCGKKLQEGKKLFCCDDCADAYKGSTKPETEDFPGSP